jgi:uncharacterized membrane protein YkvA (DUF1232 family)
MADLDPAAFFAKLRPLARKIPFSADVLAAFYCATDRETPTWVKATLIGAIAYFIAPIDAVPDFLVGLGYTDDAAVLIGALKAVSGHVTDAHKARAQDWLNRAADAPPAAPTT